MKCGLDFKLTRLTNWNSIFIGWVVQVSNNQNLNLHSLLPRCSNQTKPFFSFQYLGKKIKKQWKKNWEDKSIRQIASCCMAISLPLNPGNRRCFFKLIHYFVKLLRRWFLHFSIKVWPLLSCFVLFKAVCVVLDED